MMIVVVEENYTICLSVSLLFHDCILLFVKCLSPLLPSP